VTDAATGAGDDGSLSVELRGHALEDRVK